MVGWHEQNAQTRNQIAQLQERLRENGKTLFFQRRLIQEVQEAVCKLMEASAPSGAALYALPQILQRLAKTESVGAFLFGADGKVMLQSVSSRNTLPIDLLSKQPQGRFYSEVTGALLTSAELPWLQCARGTRVVPPVKLILEPSQDSERLYIEVSAIALHNETDTSAVLVFVVDRTELLQSGHSLEKLCADAEKQMRSIEAAERELNLLTDLIGKSMNKDLVPGRPVGSAPNGKKILIADDIPVNQKLLSMQLKDLDLDIAMASSGREAVELCKNNRYALVLMDCDMADLDGFQATEAIRVHERSTGIHTPIVAMTSLDRAGDAEFCIARGMDGYLSKGSGKARLRQIVDKYVFADSHSGCQATSPPSMPADSSGLDLKSLQDNFGADAQDIASSFFASVEPLINCLGFAIEVKDAPGVIHFAFALKGPCEILGGLILAQSASSLIDYSSRGNWHEAGDELQILRNRYIDCKKRFSQPSQISLAP